MGAMDDNHLASRRNRGAKEQWLLLNKREANMRYSHSNEDLRTGGFAGHATEAPAQARTGNISSPVTTEATHSPGSPGAGNKRSIHWEKGKVKAVGRPLWREE